MTESEHAIFVATGADRPGVLDDVSLFLHERHAHILESRVSLLRGQFALLLLIRAEPGALAQIGQELSSLNQKAGIQTDLRPAGDGVPHDNTPLRLTAAGTDPAVAVYRLSHLMRVLNVNIENIETNVVDRGAGKSGFSLEMDLSVPRATPVVMLKQFVQSLASEIGIECEVKSL